MNHVVDGKSLNSIIAAAARITAATVTSTDAKIDAITALIAAAYDLGCRETEQRLAVQLPLPL